jgi:hypothetical protein
MAFALQDSYTSDDDVTNIGANYGYWTSFVASSDYTITRVGLKLYKTGSPGDITVSIKATDEGTGKPTGGDLCSGTILASEIGTSSPGAYVYGTLGAGTALTSGTKYAILMRAGTTAINDYLWRGDWSSPPTTGSGFWQTETTYTRYTGSFSPSASPSISPSISPSVSPSISPSISPSVSPSQSLSPSISKSASPSVSPSQSVSPSTSPSASPSKSPSISPSVSPSQSASPSVSPSTSPSISPSQSASPSISPSASPSLSPSISPSVSPSPSPGWTDYTRGDEVALPIGILDLETNYTAQDIIDVATKNDIRVGQTATSQYAIHQYKNYTGAATQCTIEWEGQTNCSPTLSTVYLQIFNRNTPAWETKDTDNASAVDTDFILTASIPDLTNYKDANNTIVCRVYQLDV